MSRKIGKLRIVYSLGLDTFHAILHLPNLSWLQVYQALIARSSDWAWTEASNRRRTEGASQLRLICPTPIKSHARCPPPIATRLRLPRFDVLNMFSMSFSLILNAGPARRKWRWIGDIIMRCQPWPRRNWHAAFDALARPGPHPTIYNRRQNSIIANPITMQSLTNWERYQDSACREPWSSCCLFKMTWPEMARLGNKG